MKLGMEVGLGPGHIVLDGHPPSPKGTQPQILGPSLLWPNGWKNQMPLGTQVGLGPGDIVLDGDPVPTKKGHTTPTFRPMSIVAKQSPISDTAELLYKMASNIARSLCDS